MLGGVVMWAVVRVAVSIAVCFFLGACASPLFIHDPQIGFVSRDQIPYLIKSLRCELATYIAATNQRQIIHTALITPGIPNLTLHPTPLLEANKQYPYFAIDPSLYAGIAVDLKIQDTAGVQSGSSFAWKRTEPDKIHAQSWTVGPTLSDQSTYEGLIGFLMPQDIYRMVPSTSSSLSYTDAAMDDGGNKPFLCFNTIPTKPDVPFGRPDYVYGPLTPPQPPASEGLQQTKFHWVPGYPVPVVIDDLTEDIEGLAGGNYRNYEDFDRVMVNGTTPFAAWLQEVSTTMTSSMFIARADQREESVVPAQMTYTFAIQVTAGLDGKTGWTTRLWTLGGEASAGIQHTSTLTLVLNAAGASLSSGTKGGTAARTSAVDPTKAPELLVGYTPVPVIQRVSHARRNKNLFIEENISPPVIPPTYVPQKPRPPFVPQYQYRPPGQLLYPLPLSPLGGSS
jgi:hypothetical protein